MHKWVCSFVFNHNSKKGFAYKTVHFLDSLQPLRKISIVSPVNSHPIHASAHSGIDVFFAGSGPTGTGAPNQNSTFFEIIGSENAKVCEDIKDWWADVLEAR